MNPDSHRDLDKYQQAWQAQSSQTRVTVDADLLLKELQRSQQNFRSAIIWSDFVELGIVLLLLPTWVYLGVASASPWSWYLTVPVLVWNVVFMRMYRMRRKQKAGDPGETLLHCVKESLADAEDQIWLQRNIFWWNLLPLSVSLMAFLAHVELLKQHEDWWDALDSMGTALVFLAVFYFVYLMTQYAVRSKLEPRRQELLKLLASLGDEATSEDAHENATVSVAPFEKERLLTPRISRAKFFVTGLFTLAIVLLVLLFAGVMINMDPYHLTGEGYPKRSPFAAVRWQESEPEVRLGDEWFKLVSLDELPAAEIVAFSQRTYRTKWRKRFEEDLVELLTGMGHPPQDKVTLVVQSLTSSETWVREDVPMTYANRRAIRNAASERAKSEP